MSTGIATRRTAPDLQTCRDLEQFLYDEADLLDAWQFDEWLTLMAPDVRYWAPVRENRLYREQRKEMYAPGTSAHFDDTHEMLVERVQRLKTHMAWAEEPSSRTRHLVTNIRVYEADASDAGPAGDFEVESSFHVFRTRAERDHDGVIGKRFDLIRRCDRGNGFEIVNRKIVFDMATLLVKNLSLFY